MTQPKLYTHQQTTVNVGLLQTPLIFDTSDPGTGKTLAHLEIWATRRRLGGGKLLVVCPKTLVETAWIEDAYKFYKGEFEALPAYANDRALGFSPDADITVINTDGVNWVRNAKPKLSDYDTIIFDESEAFKHKNSKRSKNAAFIAKYFKYRNCLSGTPMNKSVTELWHQVYLLDFGQRLGSSFYNFQNVVCEPVMSTGMYTKWKDKDGAEQVIAGVIADISVRHVFEKCVDIKPNIVRIRHFTLPKKLQAAYDIMAAEAVLLLGSDEATAVNAAVMTNKLLQIASGSVYTTTGKTAFISNDRYELVIELAKECPHSVIFFEWTHERDALIREAAKQQLTFGLIDGTVPQAKRAQVVTDYQNGKIRTILAHPKSASHGLTLTKGIRTIWTHPPYSPSTFKQGNGRIYRIGQKLKTETIIIAANNTIESKISNILAERDARMKSLLELMAL